MAAPDTIHYCPSCGQPVITKEIEGQIRPYCVTCDRAYFQDPKVAAAVLVENEGKVLLVKRANVPEKGKWTLPAGFVDAGEDPQEAARRECLEETGLHVNIQSLLDVYSGKEHERGADIVILYKGQVEGGSLTASDDAEEVAFFASDEVPSLAFDVTRKVINAWLSSR
jgi:ADP-ribose pyrophosphatase YjhB (NUDIX family)